MNSPDLTAVLKQSARQLGFQLSGACPAVTPSGLTQFRAWLSAGYAGEMRYLENRAEAYQHPRHVMDGARSILMLGMRYRTATPQDTQPGQGRVSRYAWGSVDYHDLIHERLKRLAQELTRLRPQARVRGVVDSAPLLEREFARLAGLGWIGKNTLLLNKSEGSWFFLAALLTDLELKYDAPSVSDHCGSCTACLDSCPTQAFPQPYLLDATRCISYLNIELKDSIPLESRSGIDDWLFGCDICQEVCPWNGRAPQARESGFGPSKEANPTHLGDLFALSDSSFRHRFRKTPLWRPKRRGILRNAAIVLGNQRATHSAPSLIQGLADVEPLVRESSAWALGQIDGLQAAAALRDRIETETDPTVQTAIRRALNQT